MEAFGRMSKVVLGIVALFIFLVVLMVSFWIYKKQTNLPKLSTVQLLTVSPSPVSSQKVSFACQPKKNVLELLQMNASNVDTKDYSFGKMVESINGVSTGNGKYWMYTIDGKEATSSAYTYICQGNEQVSWELK